MVDAPTTFHGWEDLEYLVAPLLNFQRMKCQFYTENLSQVNSGSFAWSSMQNLCISVATDFPFILISNAVPVALHLIDNLTISTAVQTPIVFANI